MTPFSTVWQPVPGSPQEKFLRRREFEGLYGGAAGGMKTETLINLPVEDLLRWPGITSVFFRRMYGQMEDAIARAQELFKPLGAEYNESKHRFTFQNGSRYYFHHMQHEKDKLVYQGRKFEIVLFDELTHFTESQYLYLWSRCRGSKNVEWKMRSATNPGGVGHGWVKRRFIDMLRPYTSAFFLRINGEDTMVHKSTPFARDRFWIPAKVHDNPFYRDTDYVANLMAMEVEQRRMLLEGDWEAFSGQFFTTWRKSIHVIPAFRLPEHWNYFGAFDYGSRNPTAYLVLGVDPEGGVWVVREYYQDKEKSIAYNARQIKAMEEAMYPIKVRSRLADPSIWNRTPKETEAGTDDSIAQMYARQGVGFVKANNQREVGWAAVKEYLAWESAGNMYAGDPNTLTRAPMLHVFDCCTNLIRTMPDMVYENVEGRKTSSALLGEDMDTTAEDHLIDALRYGLMHVYKPGLVRQTRIDDWRRRLNLDRNKLRQETTISLN